MTPERQLISVTMGHDADHVKIKFREITVHEAEGEGEGDKTSYNIFVVESDTIPHKDFIESMKKLRKFALAANEIEVDSKSIGTWSISKLKISGDHTMKQSRIVLTLSHYVKRTKKVVEMPTGQITMYPETDDASKFPDVDKMTPIVEDVIEECWCYIEGTKVGEESEGQLPLFPKRDPVEA